MRTETRRPREGSQTAGFRRQKAGPAEFSAGAAGFCWFSACGIDPCSPPSRTGSAVTPVTLKTRVGPPTTAFYRGCFGDEQLFRFQSNRRDARSSRPAGGKRLKKQANKFSLRV